MKNIVILGCTGSIGDTTFKVLEKLSGEEVIDGVTVTVVAIGWVG